MQCFRERRSRGHLKSRVTVPVVRIGGQVTCSRVARVVVSKDEAAVRRHIVAGLFEPDDREVQLQIFLRGEYRPISKCRGSFYDSCYRRAIFIAEGV